MQKTLGYFPKPVQYFINDYLTFTALEDGQFTLKLPATITATQVANVSYRVNEGEWVETVNDNTLKTITVDNVNNDSDITITFKNDDENIDYTSISSSNWFIANQLELAYFEKYNTLVVNEIKTNKIQSIWKLPTNITT